MVELDAGRSSFLADLLLQHGLLGRAAPSLLRTVWSSLEDLPPAEPARHWILLEGGPGGAFLGPGFGRGGPCLTCFLTRRASNGLTDLHTVRSLDAQEEDTLVRVLRSGVHLKGCQVDLTSGEEHRVVGVPGCPDCREEGTYPLRACISSRVGLVHQLQVTTLPGTELTQAVAMGADTVPFLDHRAFNSGSAVDNDPERAIQRALGESLERYAAAFPVRPLVYGQHRPAGQSGPVLGPHEFGAEVVMPGPLGLAWTLARSPRSRQEVWVPAELVGLPCRLPLAASRLAGQASHGLAAHTTFEEAQRRALGELVERDAFIRVWRGLVGASVLRKADTYLLHLPTPEPWASWACFLEQPFRPYTAVGSAARSTGESAQRHAELEALAVRQMLNTKLQQRKKLGNWSAHAVEHGTSRVLQERRLQWLNSLPAVPIRAVMQVSSGWPEDVQVDLTLPDTKAFGVHVARVLVPGLLQPERELTDWPTAGPHPLS